MCGTDGWMMTHLKITPKQLLQLKNNHFSSQVVGALGQLKVSAHGSRAIVLPESPTTTTTTVKANYEL